jgi:hypothetical protein
VGSSAASTLATPTSLGSVFGYTTGLGNVGIGCCAGNKTQTGCYNFAAGCHALVNNTIGCHNFAQGTSSLGANISGSNNFAVGYVTLSKNTTGDNNFAVGCYALLGNCTGSNNFAVGYLALADNQDGNNNVAVGCTALTKNKGDHNIAIGHQAARHLRDGCYNIGIGQSALYGSPFISTISCGNTAVGSTALYCNTTGCYNIAVGYCALFNNTVESHNIAIGCQALGNTTGRSNIGVGAAAGSIITTGINNTVIGALPGTAGMSSTVLIGAGATERIRVDSTGILCINSTSSLQFTSVGIGAAASGTAGILNATALTTQVGTTNGFLTLRTGTSDRSGYVEFWPHSGGVRQGYIGFAATNLGQDAGTIQYVAACHEFTGALTTTGDITAFFSDRRLKTNVCVITDAVTKVRALTGIRYTPNQLAEQLGFATDESIVGLFADELEAVLPEAVKLAPFDSDENGDSKSGENYKTIQYEKVVPLLVEAIKELSREFEEFKKKFS